MNQIAIDIKELASMVKEELAKPPKVWDDYVPIKKTDTLLTVYITSGIASAPEYSEACYEIENAVTPVQLVLNTPGGLVSSAFMLINAMKKCQAPIHGIVTGEVASAGTIIAMFCDTLEVEDYAQFMVHNYSHGVHGGGAQVKDYVDFTDREFSKNVKEIYNDFLTPEEMEQVSRSDKELWFNKEQVLERWARKQGA